ncbi:MAG: hypothetical protein NT031_04055 [Planctomycetota bacterium]|nr:hypothetical protein [Planctomycetota bacterium]
MNSRDRVAAIVDGRPVDRCAYWTGNPHGDSHQALLKYFRCGTLEDLFGTLGDDVRWIPVGGKGHMPAGALADCDSVAQVEDFPWPTYDDFDFTPWLAALDRAGGYYRLSGNLSMFFHCDCFTAFGRIQDYLEAMITRPAVVHALTRCANEAYLRLNRRFFELAGDRLEALKISHDFGTQRDVLMSPSMFEEFVFPYLKQQIDLGHEFGHKVLLHCCGAIRKILPRLIELGIDLLHPIQSEVPGMDAESLVPFKGQVTFIGGIGTQQLLVSGTPAEVRAEVLRVARVLGPLVISPSHEALLPNVPPANVEAMARAVLETAGL